MTKQRDPSWTIGLGIIGALVVTLIIAIGSAFWSRPAHADPLVKVFAGISPSIAALYAQKHDGSLQFLCSTTAVEKQAKRVLLLTALHCVEKDVAYLVSFDGKQFYSARVWSLPKWKANAQKHKKGYGVPDVDMAFFAIELPLDVKVIQMADDNGIKAGHPIVMVGYPLGITKISYNGIISGRLDRPGDGNNGYMTMQIFGSPGSSGSSVIDQETGKVIGVLVSAAQSGAGLPVIFATPSSYRKYMLELDKVSDGSDEDSQ
jgi:V8-like Glu-specific endopeptidase